MIIKRESKSGSNDLHTVYRPCKIDEIVGQTTNVKILKKNLDEDSVPHTQLFTGHAGCGKTSAARIVALSLNCEKGVSSDPCLKCRSCKSILNGNSIDVREINVGKEGGKADVENVVKNIASSPYSSRHKIFIFDEAHKLTEAAKDSLLKTIEDGYSHVYFIFCTNQPEKLKGKKKEDPFLDRCTVKSFDRLNIREIYSILQNVSEFEGMNYNIEVLKYIAEECNGVPRRALIWLNQINDEGSWMLAAAKKIAIDVSDMEDPQVFELAKLLLRGDFATSVKQFPKLNMPVESIRIAICGFFVGCLKRSNTKINSRKISKVLDILTEPMYDNGKVAEHKFFNLMFKITDIMQG